MFGQPPECFDGKFIHPSETSGFSPMWIANFLENHNYRALISLSYLKKF